MVPLMDHYLWVMDYLLEVPKEKQAFIDELLRGFPFIKARKLSVGKAERMRDLIDAVAEINAIEVGKRKARSMKSLLREL
jgi:hypothetical protein